MSEARVLRVGAALALVQLLPASWLFLSSGLLPLIVTQAVSVAATAWVQAPLYRWMEGGTGASLINVGKAGNVAAGAAVSIPVLGGFAAAVVGLAAAGAPYAHLVDVAHGRMLLVAVLTLAALVVVATAVGRMRIGTADELEAALVREGATPDEARLIKSALALHGVRDVGSAAALYMFDEWRPRFASQKRRQARAKRRQSIGLPDRLVNDFLVPALEKLITGHTPPGNVSRAQAGGHADDDHPPTADADLDDRRPRPLLQALNLGRTARAAVRRAVLDLRNKGPPPDPPTGGGGS